MRMHMTHRPALALGVLAAAAVIPLGATAAYADQGQGAVSPRVELNFPVSTGGAAMKVRSCAHLSCSVVSSIPNGDNVTVSCQTTGDTVTGHLGTSDIWDRILGENGPIGYASDTNIRTGYDGFDPNLPRC